MKKYDGIYIFKLIKKGYSSIDFIYTSHKIDQILTGFRG